MTASVRSQGQLWSKAVGAQSTLDVGRKWRLKLGRADLMRDTQCARLDAGHTLCLKLGRADLMQDTPCT